MKGGKGVGKGTLGNALCRLFGAHGMQISNREHLVGKFNMHQMHTSFLFADEAYWPGDKQSEGTLKRLITEPTLTIEPKGIGVFTVKNSLHVLVAGNEEWMVPASDDERRYAMFEVSKKRRGDKAYFDALHEEIATGGVAAMLHDLLAMDLAGWHPRNDVPKTDALREQKELSMPPADQLVRALIDKGLLPDAEPRYPNIVPTSKDHNFGLWGEAKSLLGSWCPSPIALGRSLKKDWGFTNGKRAIRDGIRRRFVEGYKVPPLWELRQTFEKKYPGTEWDDPDQREWGELAEEPTGQKTADIIPLDKKRRKKKSVEPEPQTTRPGGNLFEEGGAEY